MKQSPKKERDPSGKNQHEPGAKLDDGKVKAGVLAKFGLALMEVLHGMVCDGRGHGCCGAGGRDGGHGIERWQGRSRAGCLRDPVGCEADARSALTISRGEWSVRATAGPRVVPFGSTSGGGNGSAGEPIAFDQSELRGKHLRRNGRAGVGGAVDRLNRSRGESAERCGVRGVRRVRCVLGESARLGL